MADRRGRSTEYGEALRTFIPKTKVQNFQIPKREIMDSGHSACPGCGVSLSLRYALKALGKKTAVVISESHCSLKDNSSSDSSSHVSVFRADCKTAAFTVSGVRAGLDFEDKADVTVVAWIGAEKTFKIGLQNLSGAAERNENIIYVSFENETITKPKGVKPEARTSLMEILAALRIPYAATATVAYPEDFIGKFKKAKRIKGTRLLRLLAPCPLVWKIPQNLSVQMARLAVHTGIFPLYEVQKGEKYTLNVLPRRFPVEEYFRPQSRFRHLTKKQIAVVQRRVEEDLERLLRRAEG
jgi:pyruvate/2-oxoacid:ferredoxin oxidoreductase beta subunit